jgi:hypothetical protein
MPLTLPVPIYNGIKFDNELQAKWAVAFDELGIKWTYFHKNPEFTFELPTLGMIALVFYSSPNADKLAAANNFACQSDQQLLLLIGPPGPFSYFAIGRQDCYYEVTHEGAIYFACDYLIFDPTTTSEGRFFVNTGEDNFCFPDPIQSEIFEEDCENLAIIKAQYYSASKPFKVEPANSFELSITPGTADFNTWFIEGDELVLKREDWRRIDFEQCNRSAQILDWIFHYQSRITTEELGDMIEALQAILHPMANYCSSGVDKEANGLSLLRNWLEPKTKRKPMKPSLRFEILKRDDYRCQICGDTAKEGAKLEVDHIHPVSKGGSNNPDNLQVLCRDCNAGKGVQYQ